MRYEGAVYRPPSEARSLIVQCTIGCSHNACTFCYMYRDDRFRIRKLDEIVDDLIECGHKYPDVEKLFLADGDALVMRTEELVEIMRVARREFPRLRQVTCYATVRDILNKKEDELRRLRSEGLDMCYVGLESGSDTILKRVNKNNTAEEFVRAIRALRAAGIRSSVTIISGLGERELSREHAIETARVISDSRPEFAAFLSLYIGSDTPLRRMVQDGTFTLLSDAEVLAEMRLFLEHVDSPGTVFRSNHASNPLALAGTLNQDRDRMIREIDETVATSGYIPSSWRSL
ncbi:MAG: radical SAM protein [Bacillota bacterium]|nr:radical SAM protein [Bacillota bacterium]